MWLRRSLLPSKSCIRFLSSQPATANVKFDNFRTIESNPTNHTENHLSRFYTIDPTLRKTTFYKGSMPKHFYNNLKPFAEMCLMIREPAVEVMGYLKKTDYKKPVNRFVFYGELGCGKSMQLLHLIHYGQVNDFIIFYVPWVPYWYKVPKERSNSEKGEGFLDVNIDAAEWLIHFKTQNSLLLQKLNLKCSKDYVWSQRESTPAGATLLELIEHGINRVKFATNTISVLVEELKQQSTAGKCRTMVAIDGFNAFFHPETKIKFDNRIKAKPENITITEPFLSITKSDWSGGVCLLVVDKWALTKDRMDSDLPKYLLRRRGFEFLDPFIPIHVDLYNDQEFYNIISYYLDRKWIQNYTPGMEEELKFVSGRNGFRLRGITAPL